MTTWFLANEIMNGIELISHSSFLAASIRASLVSPSFGSTNRRTRFFSSSPVSSLCSRTTFVDLRNLLFGNVGFDPLHERIRRHLLGVLFVLKDLEVGASKVVLVKSKQLGERRFVAFLGFSDKV